MTNMDRLTISLPNDLTERIYALRISPEFRKASFAELVRVLVSKGLDSLPSNEKYKGE